MTRSKAGQGTQARDRGRRLGYALHIDFERMGRIARENGALFMVDIAHYAGLVRRRLPQPGSACRLRHLDHARRCAARGGVIMMKAEHEKIINSAITSPASRAAR